MLGSLEQIKVSYEINGMTPEEIAEDQSLDLPAIKAALMSVSSKYRKDCGAEPIEKDDLNFSDDELREVNKVIFEAALAAEHSDGSIDWRTRLSAATYIRDDKKGRKEAVKHMGNNTFNVLMFNEQLKQAKELSNKVKQKYIDA